MLEILAGRLKWERTGDGIRVVIPTRFNWLVTRDKLFYAFITMLGFCVTFIVLSIVDGKPVQWGIILCFALGYLSSVIVLMLTDRTIMSLNKNMMTIQYRSCGIVRRKKKYLTELVYDLRFADSSHRAKIRNVYRQNEIQFGEEYVTQSFAFGITEQEADALIEKMMEVYKFPKRADRDQAPESTG
jgi:hypothetical protein